MQVELLESVPLPNRSVDLMCDVLRQLHIDPRPLLQEAEISPSVMVDPLGEVLGVQELEFQKRFAAATKSRPDLWFLMGLRYRVMAFPLLGPAMLTSLTVKEGLDVVVSFQALTYDMLQYLPFHGDGEVRGVVADDVYVPVELRPFCWMRGLAAATVIFRDICPGLPIERVEVPGRPPGAGIDCARMLEVPVEFGAPVLRWHFAPGAGQLALPMASALMGESYRRSCAQVVDGAKDRSSLVSRLRPWIVRTLRKAPSASVAAAEFDISERTLNRQLAQEGWTYGKLVDEVRLERSRVLLEESALPIADVSEALGFSESASFSRAFKRWTRQSPRAYREQRRRSA